MKTKILITGGSGFLDSRLAYCYRDRYDLLLPSHSELNISHEESVRAYLEEHRPEAVIHCAALSNTWYCEQHPEESHKVNVQGTVRIAKACKLTGAKLIFMSSDQVYNGTTGSGALKEEEVLQPVNIYGRHKLEAEQRTLMNLPDAVGLRLTWMYDLPDSRMKLNSNILVNLQKASDEGIVIKAATHEFRGVTYVWDVVRNMEKALSLSGGIYNFGSGNSTSNALNNISSNALNNISNNALNNISNNALNSYELFLKAAALMGLKEPSAWILPDEERFRDHSVQIKMTGNDYRYYKHVLAPPKEIV